MKNILLKTIKMNRVLTLALVVSFAFTSCVQDDDFTVPRSLGDENNQGLVELLSSSATPVSISELKDQFVSGEATEIASDIYVKGYVTSSDATGNFYKEFFIQDHPTNPTSGLKVVLNLTDSYNQFNIGREVYIKLQGLYIGETRSGDDVIGIGGKVNTEGDEIEDMTANQIPNHIFRSEVTETIEPKVLTFSQVNDSHIGMYVMFENAQFPAGLAGESFVDPNDDFDTSRIMESCEGFDYTYFPVETSSFANFKNVILPTNSGGTISGVINKTFNGSNTVLVLNSIDDVNLTNSKCEPLDINDFDVLFEENFEGMPTYTTIASNGWTAYAQEGGYNWRAVTTNDSGNSGPGNTIASMGAYNSGDNTNIAWLISPGVDLDVQDFEFLSFETSNSFSDNSELELLISTDWDGTEANITNATWEALPGNIVDDSEYYQNWVSSGAIDLSSFSGTAYIAFKFTGGDNANNEDGTYEIDNFKVVGL